LFSARPKLQTLNLVAYVQLAVTGIEREEIRKYAKLIVDAVKAKVIWDLMIWQ
jgi:hypothetical protein